MSKPNVFFEITADGKSLGKIVFKLYDDVVPKTAQNFRELATSQKGYQGSILHEIQEKSIHGGRITNRNGTKFADENFEKKHNKRGVLSMANAGKHTNGSEFFITTAETPQFDNKCVVFGEILKGDDVLHKIENLGEAAGTFKAKIVIAKSGTV